MSIARSYAEITPLNNITQFSSDSGQNVISFQVPPVPRILDELNMFGTLQVDITDGTSYKNSDIDSNVVITTEYGVDNLVGIDAFIDRIEVRSLRGNTQLEQQLDVPLVSKVMDSAPALSLNDACVGNHNVCRIGSSYVAGSMRKLCRAADSDPGTPFVTTIKSQMLKRKRNVPLDRIGGLRVDVYLSNTKQALFNLRNAAGNKVDDNTTFKIRSPKLFLRYRLAPQENKAISKIGVKLVNNFHQTVQSSNETLQFSPQVRALDKAVFVSRPNEFRNNPQQCETRLDELPDQKKVKYSKDGQRFPYDYEFENTPDLSEYNTNSRSITSLQSGCAESVYHATVALNGVYPCYHTMAGPENEVQANEDLAGITAPATTNQSTNYNVNNVRPNAVSYNYGYRGFPGTAFMGNLLGVQLESDVKVTRTNTGQPTAVRNQAQATNSLLVYNAMLDLDSLALTM